MKMRFFTEKYLHRLAHDKEFLLNCVESPQLYAGNAESYLQLQGILSEALKKVNRKQKTLIRLRPMYTYKMKEAAFLMSANKLEKVENEAKQEQLAAAKLVLNLLKTAHEAQINRKTLACLRAANRAREFVLSQPSRVIYDKSVYIKQVYQIIGDCYLGMKEFIPDWTQEENDFRILYMMGVSVANENEEEHLRGSFLPYIYDPRKLLEDSEREMTLASSTLERVFLFHEMGRSLGQLQKWEQARSMSRRCAQEARNMKSNVWTINGMFMVARFESIQRNFVDAKNTITEAAEIAKSISCCGEFLSRTLLLLEFADTLEQDANMALIKRQKDMLDAMPNRFMKMTMGHIFNIMSRLPPESRMMLVPGMSGVSSKKKKSKTKKLSRSSLAMLHGNVRDRRRNNARNPEMVRSLDPRIKQSVAKSVKYSV